MVCFWVELGKSGYACRGSPAESSWTGTTKDTYVQAEHRLQHEPDDSLTDVLFVVETLIRTHSIEPAAFTLFQLILCMGDQTK